MGQYLNIAREAIARWPGPAFPQFHGDKSDLSDKSSSPRPSAWTKGGQGEAGKSKRPTPWPATERSPCSSSVPREWADGIALLRPMSRPRDVPARRWETFKADTLSFIENWASTAAAMEWVATDIWGCHPEVPFARIEYAGLLWLLNGDEIVALTSYTATIRTRTGARQTYRRRTRPPGTVLAWELDEGAAA